MKRFQTPFFIGYLLFFLIGSFMLFTSDKITLQLNTNALHTIFLDATMPYITWMGDGLFAILVAVVILLFFHRRLGSLLLIGYAGSALLAQGAKRLLFPEAMRPYFFLKYHPSFHKIPHFLYYEFHSFPSGHTTTAFAMATVLAWHCSPSWKQWALLMLACLVGFSRTYLSQHFLVDVLAGSMLGVCCGLMLVVFWPQHWLSKQTPLVRL